MSISKNVGGRPRTRPHRMRSYQEHRGYQSTITVAEYQGAWHAWLHETKSGHIVNSFADRYFAGIRFKAENEERAYQVACWWWGLSVVLKQEVPDDPPKVEELHPNEHTEAWRAVGLKVWEGQQREAVLNKPKHWRVEHQKSVPSITDSSKRDRSDRDYARERRLRGQTKRSREK